MTSDPNGGVCLIRRVVIRNYKSIAACDVELGPLTFLVGPNGSGKSNFLDALGFVTDALRNSLAHAFRERGGFGEVLRRSTQYPTTLGVRLEFQLLSEETGHFAFTVEQLKNGFVVQKEECFVRVGYGKKQKTHFYRVTGGTVESSLTVAPAASHDRLYLVNVSGYPGFRPVYDALSSMGFYNINPDVIRAPQHPEQGDFLLRNGSNSHSVLANMQYAKPALKSRIAEYMAQVVPGIHDIYTLPIGAHTVLGVRQDSPGSQGWHFQAANMSDGTLRALGILIALFQQGLQGDDSPLLIGLEEPETALHPAATGVLIDAMRDATGMRQILVTSHSPELLNSPSILDSEIVGVVAEGGETLIGHLDEASRSVLRDQLFTAGDLLRMNQLRPDSATRSLDPDNVQLFGTGAPA